MKRAILALALVITVGWAGSASATSVGAITAIDLDAALLATITGGTPVEANSVRMPLVAGILFGGYILNNRPGGSARVSGRTVLIIGCTGLLGMGFGSYLFLKSIDMIGPTKTAVLGALAPVFTMGMAAVFLKERITRFVVIGVLLCVSGVWLVL